MIPPLTTLADVDALLVAAKLLAPDIRLRIPISDCAVAALKAAQVLPGLWQREWAQTTLRRAGKHPFIRSMIAAERRSRFGATFTLSIHCADFSSTPLVTTRVAAALVNSANDISMVINGDKTMNTSSTDAAESLPLQIHLGELRLGLDELLALTRGEHLSCPIPDTLSATVHALGGPVGRARISFQHGTITLTLEQLFGLSGDKNSQPI